jgi:hypothetical protein
MTMHAARIVVVPGSERSSVSRPFLRQFLLSYLRFACFIVGLGCLLAAANVGRLAMRWRDTAEGDALLAALIAAGFTLAGGGLILLGVRAPWRRRWG